MHWDSNNLIPKTSVSKCTSTFPLLSSHSFRHVFEQLLKQHFSIKKIGACPSLPPELNSNLLPVLCFAEHHFRKPCFRPDIQSGGSVTNCFRSLQHSRDYTLLHLLHQWEGNPCFLNEGSTVQQHLTQQYDDIPPRRG